MKEKIINYFFDEDDKELAPAFMFIIKLAMVSFTLTILINLL